MNPVTTKWLDAHIEKFERMIKLMPAQADVEMVVLRGHLLVEEVLTEIIRSGLPAPDALDRANLRFYQKARMAEALVPPFKNDLWKLIDDVNAIRNSFSHSLAPPKLEDQIKTLRTDFRQILNPDVAIHENSRDLVRQAVLWIVGALGNLRWKHDGVTFGDDPYPPE